MHNAPDHLKNVYRSFNMGRAAGEAEKQKVREAMVSLIPGSGYVKAVNRWAALRIAKDLLRGAYEQRFVNAVGVGSLKFDFSLTSSTGTGRMLLWLGR
jgi:hypothetical protein